MNEHYSLKNILKYHADFNLIYGPRSNGKTYSVIEYCLKNHYRLAYIRRSKEQTNRKDIKNLFEPHAGKWQYKDYTDIIYRGGEYFYCNYDQSGKACNIAKNAMCKVFFLNTWENQKGADNGKFDVICFDEFLSTRGYLQDEVSIFKNVLSTIIRDRSNTIIFMLGNTDSKINPYFSDFNITDDVNKMSQGDIICVERGEFNTKIAFEWCGAVSATQKVRKFFEFGKKGGGMIVSGQWQYDTYPHCQYAITKDNILKTAYVIATDYQLAIDICNCDDNIFLRIRKQTKNVTEDNIIYNKQPSGNPLYTTSIFKPKNKIHNIILQLFNQNLVYYTDNEVGDIFKNYIIDCKQRDANPVYILY